VPRPLDRDGQLTLMHGAISRNPPWQYFAALRNQVAQAAAIFVDNQRNFIRTKTTYFFAQEASPAPQGRFLFCTDVCHITISYEILWKGQVFYSACPHPILGAT
jgi:hypothetical protein